MAGKTRRVAAELSKWSGRNFKNAQKQLTPLKYRLQELTNRTDGEQNREEVGNIVRKMEELWRQEEMYWYMRSRIQWLKWGDQNTKFFHATTVQRRQRNKIPMLRLDDQTWCRDPSTLKQHICSFYQDLFTLVGRRNYQPVLDQCPVVVNEEMNADLIKPVTREEVKKVIFQLGATKASNPDGLNGVFLL